ncbi:hypothetical protein LCI18_010463 [Fusarium solani-melongenae]|uniref:Uncharacterized protein n=1 Tax=Fusarium solani subsp. cucurbitae TaxID=2747967 RepID=A0ACD3ZHG2_FUSSC|nr:hypothetical protein LCI18_010463 [Fusarium solani-melongenae]
MLSRCCIALVALRFATAQLIIEPSSSILDEPSETAVLSGGILIETVVSQPPPALSFTDSFDPETTDGVVSESETTEVPTATSEEKLLIDTSVPPVLPGLASSDAAESSVISETDSIRSPSSPSSFTPTADGRIISTPRPVATPTAVLTPGNGTFTGIRNSTRTEAGASTTVLPSSGSGGSGSGSGGNVNEGSKNTDKDEDDEDEDEDEEDEDDSDSDDEDSDDEDEDEDEEEEDEEEKGGSSSSDSDSADATTFTSVTRATETAVAESASAGEDPSAAHHTSPGALLCLSVLVMGAAILV